jgi:hypothetical protein
MLRPAEIVGAEMAATREGAAVFTLPAGIASGEDFFDAARTVFPLEPPLSRESESWDELSESLRRGLSGLGVVVVIWPDPWLLEDFDPEAGRAAVELLSGLGADSASLTTILGTRGI